MDNNHITKVVEGSPYYLGIPSMDGDHTVLLDLADSLLHSINSEEVTKMTVVKSLLGFYDFLSVHVQNEETLLDLSGYPDFLQHKKKHGELLAKFKEVHDRYLLKEDTYTVVRDLCGFSIAWLTNHIRLEDAKYVAHVKAYLNL